MTRNAMHGSDGNFDEVRGEDVSGEYRGVRVTLERITPDVAKRMLRSNTNNRKPHKNNMARDMRDGKWVLNGATIVFSKDGRLLDGQNRLMACVAAQVPFDTFVVRGLDDGSQTSMDSGEKRQVRHFLEMMGYKDANNVASIGAAMLRADDYGIDMALRSVGGMAASYTTREILEFTLDAYESRIATVLRDAHAIANPYPGYTVTTVAVCLDAIRSVASDDDYAGFVHQMRGQGPLCDAAMLMHRKLARNAAMRDGRLTQRTLAALTIKVWNSYIRGEGLTELRFRQGGANPERFPTPIQSRL